MKFSEILNNLAEGEMCYRAKWDGLKFIVKQIPQVVPAEVVPRMTSLPESARSFIGSVGEGTITYHDQVLIVECTEHGVSATGYTPTWEDIFSEDWLVG